MHATLALCAMSIGGWVSTESEITTLPLHENLSIYNDIQDRELKENTRHAKLPKVPTIGEYAPSGDYSQAQRGYRATNPTVYQNRPGSQGVIPPSPTSAGDIGTGGRPLPSVPTGGSQGGYSGQSAYYPNQAGGGAGGNDPYANRQIPGSNPLGPGAQVSQAQRAGVATRASNFTQEYSASAYTSRYSGGATQNPLLNSPDASKPFESYQPPSGVSPWQNLYNQNTSNGTNNPYYSAVRPALQQQQFNQRVSAQIGGVPGTGQRSGTGNATPGIEQPVEGAGMVNPNSFINYGNYYPK